MRRDTVVGSLHKGGSLNDRTFQHLGTYKITAKDVAATVPNSQKQPLHRPSEGVGFCMATTLFNHDVDLGNAPEMFASFARFGRLSPDLTYDGIHGAMQSALGDVDVHPDDIVKMKSQVKAFRARFEKVLTGHDKWILDQLASAR